MSEKSPLDILKEAILLERRGRAFYQTAAQQSDQSAVREFFQAMAEEESRHAAMLAEQFKSVKENGQFIPGLPGNEPTDRVADQVLSQAIRDKISAAGFEAAAISAAMSMEEKAIRLYSDRAAAATDTQEAELYSWLADWERGHLKILSDLDRDLTEEIWHDNAFWPF